MITVQVNGTCRLLPAALPLVACLRQLGYDPRLVALELNGDILHRQHWSATCLQDGDVIEVVTIVGGGSAAAAVV